MLSEFFREQRVLLWQPKKQKQAKNCTNFSCVENTENFFA